MWHDALLLFQQQPVHGGQFMLIPGGSIFLEHCVPVGVIHYKESGPGLGLDSTKTQLFIQATNILQPFAVD